MKTIKILALFALMGAFSLYLLAQPVVEKIKVEVKTPPTKVGILGSWSLQGYLADGNLPRTFMGGESFPRGTIFVFGKDGRGITEYNGKRISNFNYKASGDKLRIEYVALQANGVTTAMEEDKYTILTLTPSALVVATTFEQELKTKLKSQSEVTKMDFNLDTNLLLAFTAAD